MSFNTMALLTCERRASTPGHQLVIAIGEVDLATGLRLADALREAQANARDVVLDLEGTTFMDMSGVRILLAAAEHARTAAGTLEIVHATAPVTRMLTLTGADRALERPDRTCGQHVAQGRGAGDAQYLSPRSVFAPAERGAAAAAARRAAAAAFSRRCSAP